MTDSLPKSTPQKDLKEEIPAENVTIESKPQDSYVKLAMRNMVRKGRQSLWHFFLTTVGLLGILVGLAYLTKP